MKRHSPFPLLILTLTLLLSGCGTAGSIQESSKDKSHAATIKEDTKKNSKKKISKVNEEESKKTQEVESKEETKKTTNNDNSENSSSSVNSSEVTSNDTAISTEDSELLEMANSRIHDYWHDYYCFMAGTYFSYDSGEIGNYVHISNPRINSLQDVENVWYQKFSRKYPIIYNDENQNPYKKQAFIQKDDGVYELYQIDGLALEFYFDHITQRTTDEVWFACYCKGPDGSISDTGQIWSFVYEDGTWKYGTIIR